MNIVAACPHCSAQFSFDDSQIGTVGGCPTCQGQITLAVPPPPVPIAIPPPLPTPSHQAHAQRSTTPANIVGNTITIEGTVYQLATINSVRIADGKIGCMASCFFILSTMMAVGSFVGAGANANSYGAGFFFGALALGMLVFIVHAGATKALVLTTSSGEVAALKSTNRKRLETVAQEIVNAIASR